MKLKVNFHALGVANENIFLEFSNQWLIMHEMGTLGRKIAIEVFNIPDDYEVWHNDSKRIQGFS